MLWAGLDDVDRRFPALASAIERSIGGMVESEEHPFTAHVTLARSDRPLRLPESFAETSLESEIFTVGAFVLLRSHISLQGPHYEPLETYPLMGRSGAGLKPR